MQGTKKSPHNRTLGYVGSEIIAAALQDQQRLLLHGKDISANKFIGVDLLSHIRRNKAQPPEIPGRLKTQLFHLLHQHHGRAPLSFCNRRNGVSTAPCRPELPSFPPTRSPACRCQNFTMTSAANVN